MNDELKAKLQAMIDHDYELAEKHVAEMKSKYTNCKKSAAAAESFAADGSSSSHYAIASGQYGRGRHNGK